MVIEAGGIGLVLPVRPVGRTWTPDPATKHLARLVLKSNLLRYYCVSVVFTDSTTPRPPNLMCSRYLSTLCLLVAVAAMLAPVPTMAQSIDEAPDPCPTISCDEAPDPCPTISCDEAPAPCPTISCDEAPDPCPDVSCDEAAAPCPAISCDEAPDPCPTISCDEAPEPCPTISCDEAPEPCPTISCDEAPEPCPTISCDEAPGRKGPADLTLRGNYPNPFNPTTNVTFDLREDAAVVVAVYDLRGRRVMATSQQFFEAGENHQLRLDASALASGSYIYQVIGFTETGTVSQTGRMLLLK